MFQGTVDMETATPVEASAIPDVLFERGLYWASGRSGVVNLVAAHKWFNLAALKGRVDAIALRREVAEMMSEVEIAMAQREARAWMTTHEDCESIGFRCCAVMRPRGLTIYRVWGSARAEVCRRVKP